MIVYSREGLLLGVVIDISTTWAKVISRVKRIVVVIIEFTKSGLCKLINQLSRDF